MFGIWASAGDADFANELTALKSAITTYGSKLSGLVAGISVGSEDLYRISPTGIANGENPGASPDTIVNYINQVRDAIAGTSLSGVPVGHVDTWTAWVNSSNDAVIDASDFVGVDAYPYFQAGPPNHSSPEYLTLTCTRIPYQTPSPMVSLSSQTPSARHRLPSAERKSGSPRQAGP